MDSNAPPSNTTILSDTDDLCEDRSAITLQHANSTSPMTLPLKYKYYKTTYHLFSATAAFDLLSLLAFCSITS